MSKNFKVLFADRYPVDVQGDVFDVNADGLEVHKDGEIIAHFPKYEAIFEHIPKPDPVFVDSRVVNQVRCGLLFRWGSLWVGAHYSKYNRRWCINPIPCVTLWITLKGGKTP